MNTFNVPFGSKVGDARWGAIISDIVEEEEKNGLHYSVR